MKVLALTILILAIGSLEAGLVKREVPTADQFKDMVTSWFETFQANANEWASKLKSDEIQAQAGQIVAQARTHTDPIKAEIEKYFSKIIEAAKNLAP